MRNLKVEVHGPDGALFFTLAGDARDIASDIFHETRELLDHAPAGVTNFTLTVERPTPTYVVTFVVEAGPYGAEIGRRYDTRVVAESQAEAEAAVLESLLAQSGAMRISIVRVEEVD